MRRSVAQKLLTCSEDFRLEISLFALGSYLGKAVPTEISRPLHKMEVQPMIGSLLYHEALVRASGKDLAQGQVALLDPT